jgi:diguanylate cyclase (GGDEF)-like protein
MSLKHDRSAMIPPRVNLRLNLSLEILAGQFEITMDTQSDRLPLPLRLLTAPATLFGSAAALWLTMAAHDWDILAMLAALDRVHEGWCVDETFVALFATGFAWMILVIRRSYELRQAIARCRHAEDMAEQLARHDPLTGLPNRRVFQEATARAIAELQVGGTAAVLLVDLDHFKAVNDVHDHAIGDDLLCQVAGRLSESVRGNGMLARLGGDEFAVVTKLRLDKAVLSQIADRIVLNLADPFLVQGRHICIGASVGIGIYPSDGNTAGLLLHAADLAMHRAKDAGRGTFRFFEPDMDAALREQAALKMELREAITASQIIYPSTSHWWTSRRRRSTASRCWRVGSTLRAACSRRTNSLDWPRT